MGTQALNEAYGFLCDHLAVTKDPWWIIGGAAMNLLGFDKEPVKDIDVLVSARDAKILDGHYGLPNQASDNGGLFRSSWFVKLSWEDIPIEIFSGLQVRKPNGWQDMRLSTQQEILLGAKRVFVPTKVELIDIFELWGRPKDLQRARLLRDALV